MILSELLIVTLKVLVALMSLSFMAAGTLSIYGGVSDILMLRLTSDKRRLWLSIILCFVLAVILLGMGVVLGVGCAELRL